MSEALVRVKLDLPEGLHRAALEAAWWDGARTGAFAAVLLGMLVGYLLWGRK